MLQFKERGGEERISEAKREEKQPRAKMIRSTRHTQRLDEIKRQHKTIRKKKRQKINADIVEIAEEKKNKTHNDDDYDVPEGGQLNIKECAFFSLSLFRSKRKGLDLL